MRVSYWAEDPRMLMIEGPPLDLEPTIRFGSLKASADLQMAWAMSSSFLGVWACVNPVTRTPTRASTRRWAWP